MIPTIKIVPLKHKGKNGQVPIYLQFTLGRNVNRISLKISIPKDSWKGTDKFIHERGKNSVSNARKLNQHLNSILLRAEDILLSWNESTPISFPVFKNRLLRNKPVSFYDYHQLYLSEQRKKDLGETTYITYGTQINRVNKYQKNLLISDINESWILKFEHTMRTQWGLDINSIYKVLIHMRAVLNLARKKGDITYNPFDDYEIRKVVKPKIYLRPEELQRLEKTYFSEILRPSLQKVLEQFLFACYTGLSYADLKKLSYEDLENIDGSWVISGIRQKSQRTKPLNFTIPLMDNAVKMLDLTKKTGLVFDVNTNQKTNLYIKEICKFVGINKKVTFHTARHTCGTTLINLGVPKHVVQQILGHKKSEMTDHYAKLVDKTVINEIKSLNKNRK